MQSEHYSVILDTIRKSYDGFSKSEKKIAEYMLDNHLDTVVLSSAELAERIGVSDSSVVRFAKSLGFKGFLEFKKAIREGWNTDSPYDYLKKMGVQDHASRQYAHKYMEIMRNDLDAFLGGLDISLVDGVAEKVLAASTIYVLGIGSDAVVAKFLQAYFRKMGLRTVCSHAEGCTLGETLRTVTDRDLIIMSSYPRFLKDERRIAEVARSKNAPLVILTNSEANAMFFEGAITVTLKENTKMFFNSYMLPLAFCNILLLRILELDPERIEANLKEYAAFADREDWI